MSKSLEEIDIHELLPQQEPFVMVDKLTSFDMKTTTTNFTIREDNLFVEEGRLDTCALAENIAQTCAARLGYYNKYVLKRGIQVGFIGAIRAFKVYVQPCVGDHLDTTINVLQDIMGITLVDAIVKRGEEVIAEGEMKIALNNE